LSEIIYRIMGDVGDSLDHTCHFVHLPTLCC